MNYLDSIIQLRMYNTIKKLLTFIKNVLLYVANKKEKIFIWKIMKEK